MKTTIRNWKLPSQLGFRLKGGAPKQRRPRKRNLTFQTLDGRKLLAADVPMASGGESVESESPAMIVASMEPTDASSDRREVYGPVMPATYGPMQPSAEDLGDQHAGEQFAALAGSARGIEFEAMQGSSSGSASGSGSGSACGCPANPVWELGTVPSTRASEHIGTEVVDDFPSYYVERTTTVVYRWVEFGSGVIAGAGGPEIVAEVSRWRSEEIDVTVEAGINSEVINVSITSSESSSEGTEASASVTIGGDPCHDERAIGIEQVAFKIWVEVRHAKPGHTPSWTNPIRDSAESLVGYKGAISVRVDKKCTQ